MNEQGIELAAWELFNICDECPMTCIIPVCDSDGELSYYKDLARKIIQAYNDGVAGKVYEDNFDEEEDFEPIVIEEMGDAVKLFVNRYSLEEREQNPLYGYSSTILSFLMPGYGYENW